MSNNLNRRFRKAKEAWLDESCKKVENIISIRMADVAFKKSGNALEEDLKMDSRC